MLAPPTPRLKKRSGKRSAKRMVRVEWETSASSTTTPGWLSPICTRASPKASRMEAISAGIGVHLVHGLAVLLIVGNFAVPLEAALHVGDALALDGVSQYHRGPAAHGGGGIEGVGDLADVVAVGLQHLPAKGAPLVGQGLDGHDVLGGAARAAP